MDIKRVYFVSKEYWKSSQEQLLTMLSRAIGFETTHKCAQLFMKHETHYSFWLQAMDIAGLSKLTAETIILVLSALGFMVSRLHVIATSS